MFKSQLLQIGSDVHLFRVDRRGVRVLPVLAAGAALTLEGQLRLALLDLTLKLVIHLKEKTPESHVDRGKK